MIEYIVMFALVVIISSIITEQLVYKRLFKEYGIHFENGKLFKGQKELTD